MMPSEGVATVQPFIRLDFQVQPAQHTHITHNKPLNKAPPKSGKGGRPTSHVRDAKGYSLCTPIKWFQ